MTFKERLARKNQVVGAFLLDKEIKADLDKVARATRRSKSGCVELALRQWLHQEHSRIKGSVAEVIATGKQHWKKTPPGKQPGRGTQE